MNINLFRVAAILMTVAVISVGTSGATVSGASRHVIAIDPKMAGLVKQANSQLKLEQYDPAIRDLTAALNMKPERNTAAAIYGWRASAYIHKGEFNKAMADADESIRLNPNYYSGCLERGILYRRTGNLDTAIGDYDRVIRLNPSSARA